MKKRDFVKQKYGGLCAYSGTPLLDDWQVDHIEPVMRLDGKALCSELEHIDNLVPCQKLINHYKGSLSLHEFRTWFLAGLHTRLAKLPKNPKMQKSIKKKEYLLKIAKFFDITPEKPFSGVFYFETI